MVRRMLPLWGLTLCLSLGFASQVEARPRCNKNKASAEKKKKAEHFCRDYTRQHSGNKCKIDKRVCPRGYTAAKKFKSTCGTNWSACVQGRKMDFKKVKKKFKSLGIKIKKTASSAILASRKAFKKLGVHLNTATAVISDVVPHGFDLLGQEIKNGVNYAWDQFERSMKRFAELAREAVQQAYKAAFKKMVSKLRGLGTAIKNSESKLNKAVVTIGRHLTAGNIKKSNELARALLKKDFMQGVIRAGKKIAANGCLVITADFAAGGHFGSVHGGAGIALSLDRSARVKAAVFFVVGGAITSDPDPDGGFGVYLGWLRGKPTDIAGPTVDVGGGVSVKKVDVLAAVSWAPPKKTPPFFDPRPILAQIGLGASAGGANANVSIGGSYTHIIQKIK